jgi:hypothetical protein
MILKTASKDLTFGASIPVNSFIVAQASIDNVLVSKRPSKFGRLDTQTNQDDSSPPWDVRPAEKTQVSHANSVTFGCSILFSTVSGDRMSNAEPSWSTNQKEKLPPPQGLAR